MFSYLNLVQPGRFRRAYQSGASLVEVLVSLLLLGLSVSAAFGLQLRAVYLMEVAVSSEAAFRLLVGARSAVRDNPLAASAFKHDAHWANLGGGKTQLSDPCSASASAPCTPLARALADIAFIQHKVHMRFPGSRMGVRECGDAGYCLILNWSGQNPDVCAQQSTNRSACVSLSVWM